MIPPIITWQAHTYARAHTHTHTRTCVSSHFNTPHDTVGLQMLVLSLCSCRSCLYRYYSCHALTTRCPYPVTPILSLCCPRARYYVPPSCHADLCLSLSLARACCSVPHPVALTTCDVVNDAHYSHRFGARAHTHAHTHTCTGLHLCAADTDDVRARMSRAALTRACAVKQSYAFGLLMMGVLHIQV